ncbi:MULTISPECIES: PTS sugar transporter subunit IIB [Clostridia]|uniref:PTS sugar transporter subunit IIB n=1 Tax=Clostridia TaxID=186801 RepID=UPI000EA2FDE3|nr:MULTISPECIES: PTS sugar transporter subunit IIB [Clostridia]NBJ69234.1 PTS sugar transporter subunit IIB [Roseburia sp. 1XD42-34]RKI79203.1 PTS sugar transporter subunit IIB [Clostridium sp. 1xD42-85]
MIKIVTVCGAGVGSSMMLRVYAQQVLSEEGIQATVEASDISSVSADEYDIVITTSDFADILRNSKAKVVRIDNMMDKELLRTELMKVMNE